MTVPDPPAAPVALAVGLGFEALPPPPPPPPNPGVPATAGLNDVGEL
jgi:hypothetical protein